jgi:hypothetical protein
VPLQVNDIGSILNHSGCLRSSEPFRPACIGRGSPRGETRAGRIR